MDSLRSCLSRAEAEHQAALQQIAVVEDQKQQALQDSQEQVSIYCTKNYFISLHQKF